MSPGGALATVWGNLVLMIIVCHGLKLKGKNRDTLIGVMTDFSVIIPTLNEERQIRDCIAHVRAADPCVELIVADGGSDDNTARVAVEEEVVLCYAERGRGIQCNAGAAIASGDIFLFLHADTLLPANAFQLLSNFFRDSRVQIGTFRLRFDERQWLLDFYARFSCFDSLFTTFGDQCIVVRRSFFQALGRFPPWPLFEDVKFLQAARKKTRVHSFPATVTTSARRYREGGIIKQQLRNAWYVGLYLLGVPPQQLADKYERSRG